MRFCETLAATAGIDVLRSWRPKGLEVSISMPLEGIGTGSRGLAPESQRFVNCIILQRSKLWVTPMWH
jgi:hypothetical protein